MVFLRSDAQPTWGSADAKQLASAHRWDAEFFVNPYNKYLHKMFLRWKNWVSLADASVKLTSGHTPLYHDVSEGDTPFITVECVDPLALNLEKAKRIWAYQARGELSRVCITPNDVLITIKRRIAISTPVVKGPGLMAVNQDVVVMTPKPGLRPSYIAAVLNSRVGQFQALRYATEQMNPYINVTTLGGLLIPRVPDPVQETVECSVRQHLDLIEQSVKEYQEAEGELLDRLGWRKLNEEGPELHYSTNFSTLNATERSDAEFFHPLCTRLRKQIKKGGGLTIGEFCPVPSRGVQPEYDPSGAIVTLDSKSIRPHGVEPSGERVSQAFYDEPANAKARVHKGDVLLNSTGRGTLGRAGCFQLDTPAVCDNHVAILRPDQKVCHPHFLALFLNSPAGLRQSEQFQTGSSGQLEIYPVHIQQLLIFLPRTKSGDIDIAWQQNLADKVETATRSREEAKVRLAEAKRLIEEAISGAASGV